MNTVMTLSVYGPEESLLKAVDRINRLEKLLSVTREDSEVWALNHAQGESVAVSPETQDLLVQAAALGEYTGGALDVTLYPVLKAWGFTTQEYRVPGKEELAGLLEQVDYSALQTSSGQALLPAGMELDFGALAKGYAGEICAQLLREEGVESALLMLGGNIQTVGAKPGGSPWRVLIQSPSGAEEEYLGTVEVTDQAVVTSGGYQRYFEENGVRYWHILDPKTGEPARSGLESVTVVGNSGTLCDALSTAFFVLGREEALRCWREKRDQDRDFELILADEDKGVWVTAGLKDRFTLDEASGYTLNIVEE